MTTIQILVVDDEKSIRRLIQKELAAPHRLISTAGNAQEASDTIRRQRFDIIVLDIKLPDGNGLDLMISFREMIPEAEVILITGHGDIDTAVEATKMGAYDYITKPFDLDRLELVIEKAYQRVCLQRENRMLRHTRDDRPPKRFIGRSSAVEYVRYLIQKVGPASVSVLLMGESGTGKNVVSQEIHSRSQRAELPLITKNCGTLQKELVRSEFFGHCKGAFTGANETRDGLLALAHKGTLFLDEIGELSPEVQSSLLRVLENQTYRRVGDKEEITVDVRFICATNRNLLEEVKAGRFSEALYHRLNVFKIDIPPLRERREDIPLLVEHFLGRACLREPASFRITKKAMECLMTYDWPGNIRELQNVIERGVILSENKLITERELPREISDVLPALSENTPEKDLPFLPLAEMEKKYILQVLRQAEGSRINAADILGISRKTLYRKLKSYGLSDI